LLFSFKFLAFILASDNYLEAAHLSFSRCPHPTLINAALPQRLHRGQFSIVNSELDLSAIRLAD